MADHGQHTPSHGLEEHTKTFEGFVKGSMALSLICGFILVALCAFRFMDNWNVFTGFAGIILGVLAVIIDWRTGGRWLLSGGLLVVFGLFVAANF
jgi:Bacterial aa3 type cytochrome c oxidase subunit IV